MNMQSVIRVFTVGCALSAFATTGLAIDPQLTNTTSFDIPFVVETTDGSQVGGSALLFTSVNGGPPEQTQRVPAAAGAFHFTAPSDGLYGFAVRMTDAAGKITGEDAPLTPELEVIVDTSAPELTIQVYEIGPGQISLTWISSDSQIAPGSIRLEYAEGVDGRWKPVDASPTASGQATIETQAATSVSVRGFITDLAGNQGTGTSQIVLTAVSKPAVNAVESNSNSTGGLAIPGGTNSPGGGSGSMGNGYSNNNYGNGGYGQNSATSMGATPFPVQPDTSQNYASQANNYSNTMPAQQTPQPSMNGGYPNANTQYEAYPQGNSSYPANRSLSQNQPRVTQNDYAQNSYSQNFGQSAGSYPNGNDSMTNNFSRPSGASQVVNNRVFDIAYEVQDVGPSGVGSVELFVTENNGQQWFKYGVDGDMQSPFPIDSRGEGTFGFAVRVRNGMGFADAPPQPGDAPSIVVTVDQTPPMANLSQPQIISDSRGRIKLQWQVNDSHPDAAPVRLEYAVSASGPWTPVFDWQQDRGGYEMPIQPGMPQTMHFRLLARDAAGNIATAQTPQPVLIDQRRPVARLLRVQPVSAIRRY